MLLHMRPNVFSALSALPLCIACSHSPSTGPSASALAAASGSASSSTPATPSERHRAAHALDRLAFGPRPGDIERVASIGVDKWIEQQLAPESIPDAAVDAALDALPATKMSIAQLHDAYPKPPKADKLAKKEGKGQKGENDEDKAEKGGKKAKASKSSDDEMAPGDETAEEKREKTRDKPEEKGNDKQGKPRDITLQLAEAKMLRATMSQRQLEEVLTDFWFNRFNVFSGKGQDRWNIGTYERDAIRPHVFGKFRDLLGATASHPAMLVYLDNWQSVADGTKKKGGKESGLNENYGRELLELHTLGVDGGYSQDDVRNVARAFTGWTLDKPSEEATFVFRAKQHDTEPKSILGQTINAGGKADGEAVLDLVAHHASTARSVSLALARRFVSDSPPKALVDDLAATFTSTDGDLRAVYRKLFASPAFWADEAYDAKVKKPFELAASAVRAAGATYDGSPALVKRVAKLGEPLYECQPPTGYKDTSDAWVNAGGLVNRINFGLDLGAGRIRGVKVDVQALSSGTPDGDLGASVDRIASGILDKPLSPATKNTILAALQNTNQHPKSDYQDPTPTAAPKIIGLLVGSPEFQKR